MFSNKDFINREISWLSFNERVLQEADDPNTPLFERIRFIGIFSNNLDEFFRVRVATVRRMVDLGEDEENLLGDYTPVELYDKIQNIVYEQQNKVQQIFVSIREELKQNNIFIINEEELSHKQGVFVKKYFYEKVLPNLVPIMLSKNKFPYLRDRSVYLAVKLIKKSDPPILPIRSSAFRAELFHGFWSCPRFRTKRLSCCWMMSSGTVSTIFSFISIMINMRHIP